MQCPVCSQTCADNQESCPACGFRFAGSTQGFRRITLEDNPVAAQPAVPMRRILRVVRGPQINTGYVIGNLPATIGRNPNCDIFLNDMTVSRMHAKLVEVQGRVHIIDNTSFNGTWVNNRMIEETILQPGDIIQLGVFCLTYEVE